jgi:4-amino-4-deoxy-L-arabinose transferase-like glycosyltransferase
MTRQTDATPQKSNATYLQMALVLLLSGTLSLISSHFRLMGQDEFLSFYTDGVATLKQVILVQLHHPISLDPPTYHLLSHLCMEVLGRNAFALRLPAFAGFLLFQLCLFFFVRRLAGDRAAIIAAAVPLLTSSFSYAAEGRPYGLLLGLYAFSLLCWQIATRDDSIPRSRLLPLIGLTLSIALAITSHYFGVLILIPVSLGELYRTFIRKRIDFGVFTALAFGVASLALILPFKRALMVYRQHYYIKGVNIHDISMSYRELFVLYTTWPMLLQRLTAALMLGLVFTLAYANYRRFNSRPTTEHVYTWVAISGMALLPFFGYFLGRFVTHTFEHRYVIATLIAFSATFAIALERALRNTSFYYLTLAVIVIATIVTNAWNIDKERRGMNEVLASFQLSPQVSTVFHQNPHERIYIQSLFEFYFNTYYAPDATFRQRFSLLYGQQQEIYWLQHDTNGITAVNMRSFAPLSVTSYADFLRQPHPLLILNRTSWEWIDKQLDADHTPQRLLGNALRGQLVRITNTPTP